MSSQIPRRSWMRWYRLGDVLPDMRVVAVHLHELRPTVDGTNEEWLLLELEERPWDSTPSR